MKVVMGWAAVAVLAASASMASAAEAAPASSRLAPCARLAAAANKVTPAKWDKEGDGALSPALQVAKDEQVDVTDAKTPAPGSAGAIARLPIVKAELDGADYSVLDVEHLPKSGLFQLDNVEGTLHCNYLAFVQAGGAPHIVKAPPRLAELCWSNIGDLATVYGKPAFVVHDLFDGTWPDDHIIITPWTGEGWGAACETDLHFDTRIDLSEKYCHDANVCRRAGAIAKSIVAAYNKKRLATHNSDGFAFGKAAPASVKAAIRKALAGRGETETPDFPTFGAKTEGDYDLSYNGFVYFPLELNGAWYGAAIARNGVGWREDDNALLVIYDLKAGWKKPLASFVLPTSVTRLASAEAVVPKPPKDL